jgi:hypothetical protein
MKKKQYFIYTILSKLFYEKGYHKGGTFIAEPDVMLTAIQMRRPDIAYFSNEQVEAGRIGEDVIPAFVIEVISESDLAYRIEEKIAEYFKAGVQIVWSIRGRVCVHLPQAGHHLSGRRFVHGHACSSGLHHQRQYTVRTICVASIRFPVYGGSRLA